MLTMRNALFASPRGLWTVAVLAWLVSSAWGQGPMDKPASPSIRVTGEASVTIKPDQAQIGQVRFAVKGLQQRNTVSIEPLAD